MTIDASPSSSPANSTFSSQRAARIAGGSYLLMFALAIFANFVVKEGLIVPGDAATTVANITGSLKIFRLGLLAFWVIFVLDVVIAWALHVVLRDVNRDLSLAAAWFRLVYSVFLGVSLVPFFQVLTLLSKPEYIAVLGDEQLNAQVMLALESFEATWQLGLSAFGIHLLLIALLIVRSGFVPKALGFVLAAAGTAYVVDTLARAGLASADYDAVAGVLLAAVALPSMIGEGWFGFWLLLTRKVQD